MKSDKKIRHLFNKLFKMDSNQKDLNNIIKLNLVEIVIENERYLCILHTYKLNIFKRKWRNLRRQA